MTQGKASDRNGTPRTASSGTPAADPTQAANDPDRRASRRRPAAPARERTAANDDVPSIGGLIFALHQKPSRQPFLVAGALTGVWALLGSVLAYALIGAEWKHAEGFFDLLSRPGTITSFAAIVIPITLFWFLALLVWRVQELRLMSSAMTEVAVRLAEPDRMAEQSTASLGQSVRRQVSFMNDAIGRAIGRASELEAIVHNEVAALERSYSENEFRIRNLIDELASERAALTNNSDRVSDSIQGLGAKVAQDIAIASRQATDALTEASKNIAQVIETRGSSIAAAASAAGNAVDEKLSERGNSLLSSLTVMTERIGSEVPAIIGRMSEEQVRLTRVMEMATGNLTALENAVGARTNQLDTVLLGHTRNIDATFEHRLQSMDETIMRGTEVLDQAVNQRTLALANAMEAHARSLSESLARKSADLDNTLMHGIDAVRRSSENITKQSVKTIEGLASQAELLKDVSENLLGQINTLTNRFEGQGKSIMKAAHALETSNLKVDTVLQARHSELSDLLERMDDRARSFDTSVKDYSTTLDGTLNEAERRARGVTSDLSRMTDQRSREAVAELERFKFSTEAEADRMLNDLRSRLSVISDEVSNQFSSFTDRFSETSSDVSRKALKAADELESMQARLRDQMQSLPSTSRASAEAMRRALQDQLKALEQLTMLANRQVVQNDVSLPERASLSSLTQAYSQRAKTEDRGRAVDPSLAAHIAREVEQGRGAGGSAAVPRTAGGPGGQRRTGWSLGDLLDRASREEQQPDGQQQPGRAEERPQAEAGREVQAAPPAQLPVVQAGKVPAIDIGNIAEALDPVTAADVWTRFRSGQRGILSRGLYTPEGQATFDDTFRRYQADPSFRNHVNRYLGDFERMLNDAEAEEPGGRIAENYLISDTGRVYLLLAHASGRLA